MRVRNLAGASSIYTSNVYLVQGTWNTADDVNTLIDVGRDVCILEWLRTAGLSGKPPVEQILLTHNHYDHREMLETVHEEYTPRVMAYDDSIEVVDRILRGGEVIKAGDMVFEVIHCPEHSFDSLCYLSREAGILFSGDTPLLVQSPGIGFDESYLQVLRLFASCTINTIYPGHGDPIVGNCGQYIRQTLETLTRRRVF